MESSHCDLSLGIPDVVRVSSSPLIGVQSHDITLSFSVSNDVPPLTPDGIQWFFDNGQRKEIMSNSSGYTFSSDKLSLSIHLLSESDHEGNYTLVATNDGGSDNATIFLDIQGWLVGNRDLLHAWWINWLCFSHAHYSFP